MFVHKEQLEYVLRPEQYASPAFLQAEIDRLFLSAWHPVALAGEFQRDGDFKTLELLGRPIQIRRHEGNLHAYLNVCSHRHCLLTELPRGNSGKLACQYHGWEYHPSGQVSRVPDGGCFRPFDRENARLQTFAVDTCGGLVFLRLSADGPSLAEHISPHGEAIARAFSPPYACNWSYAADFDCNWKIPVENTVETYHLPYVHPHTLGGFGLIPEEAQRHFLEDRFTTLVFDLDRNNPLVKQQRQVVGWLGGVECGDQYIHHHIFPNLVFTLTDLYMYAQVYLPKTPTTSTTLAWMFSLEGTRRNPFARVIARLAARHGAKANTAIQREDASVFAAQQRGLAATPFRGCIGTREERIWCFQNYVHRACAT
jgi:phenylpropionate dioxygenase-like ring-hydroxylating dioxygenase large terminal subunit